MTLAGTSWPQPKRPAMSIAFTQTADSTQRVTQSVLRCLGRLQQKRQLDEAAHDDFSAARAMLETILLPTDQFDLACRRLQNAQHYLKYAEPGAAWYELRLLGGSLKRVEPNVREPNRRLRRKAN